MKRLLTACTLLLALLAGCDVTLPDGVIYPSISPVDSVTEDRSVTVQFTFEEQPVNFTLTVDGALYAGAAAADKEVIRFGNARENDWIEDYFPAFITEEHQTPFYDELLSAFRAERDRRGLDADRYAEMLIAYAQSITYHIDSQDLSPKFPVETFVEGLGDCDDKTLLLAALLSREGYDVAVLMFEPEQHVALGIRSDGIGYRNTGYAFVETTIQSYVGQIPESLEGGVVLESEPRVFAVDGGAIPYASGAQVTAILDARRRAIAEIETLSAEVDAADAELASLEAAVRSARDELEALRASGRIVEYNARVEPFNDLVADYNQTAAERNLLVARHNELAAIDKLVAEGASNRTGTYSAIASF